ncbi:MAG: DUF1653 domain-containing protein [Lachnospiraceae bacterium]|nr:DUF1653 domain-containing protein [Lachnospiraceae bacterium]
MDRKLPIPGERFLDTENKMCQVICIAKHAETGEELVVYQQLEGEFSCYVKPLEACVLSQEKGMSQSYAVSQEKRMSQEESAVDPALLAFLDADTLEEKYNVLVSIQGRITDYLIDSFAVCLDVVIPQGDTDTRYRQLLSSVRTMQKYENTRLR